MLARILTPTQFIDFSADRDMKIFVFILLSVVALSNGKAIDGKATALDGKIYFSRNFRNVQIIITARVGLTNCLANGLYSEFCSYNLHNTTNRSALGDTIFCIVRIVSLSPLLECNRGI